MPGVCVACGDGLRAGGAMVDGKVQGDNAIATVNILNCVFWTVCATLIGSSVHPRVTVACSLYVVSCSGAVYCEMEGNNRVAPVFGVQIFERITSADRV